MQARNRGRSPPAIVLSSRAHVGNRGAALGVVRALGSRGVPVTLVTESAHCPATESRYVERVCHLPRFSSDPGILLPALAAIAEGCPGAPVLFPTSDTDLALVAACHHALSRLVRPVMDDPALVQALLDRQRFFDLACSRGLRVPATCDLKSLLGQPALLRFPLLLKPRTPGAWEGGAGSPPGRTGTGCRIESVEELLALGRPLLERGAATVAQEYIPGPDHDQFDLQLWLHGQRHHRACFSARKLRLYPAHAGTASCAVSEHVAGLADEGLAASTALGYTGLAELEFKRHSHTGRLVLLEVRPGVGRWSMLANRCGVNLPWLAYASAAKLPLEEPPPLQRAGPRSVDLSLDLRAWRQYRDSGEWPWARYLGSLLRGPRVWCRFALVDPSPFVRGALHTLRERAGRLIRRHRQGPRPPSIGPSPSGRTDGTA